MKPDPDKTREISPRHSIEVGKASWDETETSIRSRKNNDDGRFNPRASSEIPVDDIMPIIEVAADNDLIAPAQCTAMIKKLAASARRRI